MTKDSNSTAVQVALRIRPLTDRDRAQPRFANLANDDVLKIVENSIVQVIPYNKQFRFDHVFNTESRQEDLFTNVGDPLVRKFTEGYNVTILAYGQTSSGKTYTMGTAGITSNPSDEGIVPRSMALLFDLLQQQQQDAEQSRPLSPTSSVSSFTSNQQPKSKLRPVSSRLSTSNTRQSHISTSSSSAQKSRFSLKVSFIEIYNEELIDLLNMAPVEARPPVTIREDTKGTIYWTGVKEVSVYNTEDVLNYLDQGTRNRATGSTDMNEKSSRSHAIFSVTLRQEKLATSGDNQTKTLRRPTSSMSVKSNTSSNRRTIDEEWVITTSKFHFVDLAGSERLKRTAAQGDRRKEGININAGLSALGNVISALGGDKKVHIPYRDSKLTRLLQDSLGGNSTTLMIACASPAEHNLSETLNTLQYASRARNIRNKSEKNEMEEWMSSENLEFLRGLISKLKSEVKFLKSSKEDRSLSPQSPTHDEDEPFDEDFEQFHDQRMIIADLKRQVEELDGEATVTRERNRIVEKELQRLHTLLESKSHDDADFAHLVEPVIEEYEKSISKLESQLAMTRAALNHTNTSFEEQSNKITEMEATTQQQERSMNELKSRLAKIMEREHTNETYIQELESKLIKSADDATRDQEMLNELKSRILKLKETDENMEQYISSLEERLAAGDMERVRLQKLVDDLEEKLVLASSSSLTTTINTTEPVHDNNNNSMDEKLILQELDHVNSKLLLAEKERDSFKIKIEQLQKKSTTPTPSVSKEKRSVTPSTTSSSKSHRSITTSQRKTVTSPSLSSSTTISEPPVSPIPTSSSSSSHLLLIAEKRRVQEETERANRLQVELNRLKQDHEETVKELDEVLQRYQEALEQVDDQLDDDNTLNSSSITSSISSSNKLHLSMHNEPYYIKEKQALHDLVSDLEKRVQDLSQNKLKMEQDHADLENTLHQLREEQVNDKRQASLDVQQLQDQLSHFKQEDITQLTQSLHEKTLYIETLEQQQHQLEQEKQTLTLQRDELEVLLNESQGHSAGLHQRLKDTLASLTVLKVKHDQLLKTPDDDRRALDETIAKKESLTKLLESTIEEKNLLSADIAQLEEKLDRLQQVHEQEMAEAEQTRKQLETLQQRLLASDEKRETHEALSHHEAGTDDNLSTTLDDTVEDLKKEIVSLREANKTQMESMTRTIESLQRSESQRITKEREAVSLHEQQLAEIIDMLRSSDNLPMVDLGMERFLIEDETDLFEKTKREVRLKLKDLVDAKQAAEQSLLDQQALMEKEREKSRKAQHILEKRLDELLRKKKFMCF